MMDDRGFRLSYVVCDGGGPGFAGRGRDPAWPEGVQARRVVASPFIRGESGLLKIAVEELGASRWWSECCSCFYRRLDVIPERLVGLAGLPDGLLTPEEADFVALVAEGGVAHEEARRRLRSLWWVLWVEPGEPLFAAWMPREAAFYARMVARSDFAARVRANRLSRLLACGLCPPEVFPALAAAPQEAP